MADVTITATSVLPGTSSGGAAFVDGTWGETVTAGQVVYKKSTDSKWYKAQHDGTQEESGYGVLMGIAIVGGAVNQYARIQTAGTYTAGGTLTVGEFYMVSATAGGIAPIADIGAADYVTKIGYATTTAIMNITPVATGLAHG